MFSFVDESFREENIFEYNLSIQVSLNGFSFSIQREKDNKLLVLKSDSVKISRSQLIHRRFQDWLDSEQLGNKNFNKIVIYVFSNNFTLIPAKYNTEDGLTTMTQLLFESSRSDMEQNKIQSLDANLLFSLPENLKTIIADNFESVTLYHPIFKVLDNPLSFFPSDSLRLIYSGKDLFLLYISNSEVKTCNTFRINHPNDALFYVLSTLKQFTTSINSVPVYYCGDAEFAESLNKELPKYFEEIKTYILTKAIDNTNLDIDIINKHFCLI